MTKLHQVYKCNVCGNIVEITHASIGTLVCCNQAMQLLDEQTADMATEKHVPVIEKTANGYQVTVGSTLHPMEDKHYIEWIEIIVDGQVLRQHLQPNDQPVAEFCVSEKLREAKQVVAREYCNIHGLWRG